MSDKLKMMKVKSSRTEVKVPKPNGDWLKDEGELVPRTKYWLRRLAFGEVIIVEEKKPVKKITKKKPSIKETGEE